MGLPKGRTNNRYGRPKGTPNKVTGSLKQAISQFLNENWDNVYQDWQTLEPEKRIQFYEKLIRYILPPATDELGRLTSDELDTLIERLKKQYTDEK